MEEDQTPCENFQPVFFVWRQMEIAVTLCREVIQEHNKFGGERAQKLLAFKLDF